MIGRERKGKGETEKLRRCRIEIQFTNNWSLGQEINGQKVLAGKLSIELKHKNWLQLLNFFYNEPYTFNYI